MRAMIAPEELDSSYLCLVPTPGRSYPIAFKLTRACEGFGSLQVTCSDNLCINIYTQVTENRWLNKCYEN
jgi:hypothetical protein